MSKRSISLICLAGALSIALCGCNLNINIGGGNSETESSEKTSKTVSDKQSSEEEDVSGKDEGSGTKSEAESSDAEVTSSQESEEESSAPANDPYSAYAEVVRELIEKAGKPKKTDSGFYTGVAVVRLIDFDGDGTDELYCVYPQENDMFANKQEIYGYVDGKAVSIFKDRVQNWGTSVDPFVETLVGENMAYILTDFRNNMTETKGTWITVSEGKAAVGLSFYTNSPSFETGEGQGAELIFKIDEEKVEKAEFDTAMNEFAASGTDTMIRITAFGEEEPLTETENVMKQLGVEL